jgi:ABC-type uncharacterized transport system substrate-binding protein
MMKKLLGFRHGGLALLAGVMCAALLVFAPRGRAADEQAHPQPRVRQTESASSVDVAARRYRVLHNMSYNSPWEWTDDQLRGFKEALKGVNVEYKIFQMDTKRNSTEAAKESVGREARALIDAWKPDLVYTTDDIAQKYVASHYVNSPIPFVFSGVNADPADYGFARSSNIAGVLEHEHFVETVKLLREMYPKVTRIAVIVDEDPTWTGVIRRMREKASVFLPDCQLISWDAIKTFEDFKKRVMDYQTKADALALLGIHAFKDEKGANVPWQEVVRWTTENSRIPAFTFWKDRIAYGILCAVYVSGYEQGRAAGRIAYGILADGKSPASFPMLPTVKGEPIISLARAKRLGIRVSSDLLLTAIVASKFEWEQ